MSSVVVSSIRNEGAFLLEWVCWYRMLGFDHIVVVTNDCTDHSPELLDALARAGWVEHLTVDIKAGQASITAAKLAAASQMRTVRRAEHVLVCDVDEFLVIHVGDGRLPALLAAPGRGFLGMAINWRCIGSSGVRKYVDLPVHQQFTVAIGPKRPFNRFIKTLYGHPRWFARMGEHGPIGLKLTKAQEKAGMVWGQGDLVWVTPAGHVMTEWQPGGDYVRQVATRRIDHSVAQMNHYILRSAETFGLKRGTLSPVAGRNRYTQGFWTQADRRDGFDDSALRYGADYAQVRAMAMALPDVARLHGLCCADHVRLIADKADLRVLDDPRYLAFLAQSRLDDPGQIG